MTTLLKPITTGALLTLCLFGMAASLQAQTAAQDKLNALFGDQIIAKGDGFTISQSALDESVITIRASAAGRGASDFSAARIAQLEREVTRRLINIELLKQLATDPDRETAATRADERISFLEERAGSEQAMARQLLAVGLTVDRLRAKLTEEALAEVVLERELGIEITDEAVKTYYDENPDRFEKPEEVRVAHILLRTRNPSSGQEYTDADKADQLQRIEGLLERARKGADFAKLALEYSEDLQTRGNGGELTIRRGQMFPAFEAAAFSLAPGQISDVVTSPVGYHIIKVIEKTPARTVELEEVADEVRTYLKSQEVAAQMEPYMAELAKNANVEILVERLKPQEGDDPVPGMD